MAWWRGRTGGASGPAWERANRLLGRHPGPEAPVVGPVPMRPGLEGLAPSVEVRDPWSAITDGPASGDAVPLLTGPWTRPAVRALVAVLAACLACAAWWWWSGRPREVVPAPVVVSTGSPLAFPNGAATSTIAPSAAPAPAAPSPSVVVVDVVGLVARSGLATLPAGSRVADAVAAAGGVTRRRAAESVNLARILVDGEQIVVGVGPPVVAGGPAAATPTVPSPSAPLDLNAADAAALDRLPGVGPVLASRIVQWRLANGPFRSVDELGEVSGIGDAILAQLRPIVRV